MSQEIIEFLKSVQVVFAIAIVFVSAAGSVIVATVAGKYQQKSKHMEMYFSQRIKVYTEFIDAATDLLLYQIANGKIETETLQKVVSSCMKVQMVSPDKMSDAMALLVDLSKKVLTEKDGGEKYDAVLQEIVRMMRAELSDWKKQGRIK